MVKVSALFVDIAWNASRVVSFRVSHRFTRVERYSSSASDENFSRIFPRIIASAQTFTQRDRQRRRERTRVKEKRALFCHHNNFSLSLKLENERVLDRNRVASLFVRILRDFASGETRERFLFSKRTHRRRFREAKEEKSAKERLFSRVQSRRFDTDTVSLNH